MKPPITSVGDVVRNSKGRRSPTSINQSINQPPITLINTTYLVHSGVFGDHKDITWELNYLSSMISQLLLSGSESKYQTVSNSILMLMVKDYDLSPLADKLIKLIALPYPPFKRVICMYLIRYSSSISNLNILATNSFLKDFDDPNPYIRRLVIKTICHIPCLHELACQLLPLSFCDSSSYVRSTAVTSCTLVVNENNLEIMQSIIDKLYDMIRDADPSVVSSSLDALDVILSSEGGIVINARLSRYLISRLSEFQEWHFATVSRVLKKYIPKNTDELLLFLNALDENLSNSNPLIFNLASELALFYISALKENFSSDIIEQILPQIKFLLCHSNDELLCEILEIVQKYINGHEKYFFPFYKLLFCRFNDPTFIKVKKLKVIIDFGTHNNMSDISEELLMYSYNCVKEVAIESIKSFTKFIQIHPICGKVIESFILLMDIQHNNLNEEILISLSASKLEKRDYFKNIFLPAVSKKSFQITSKMGKLALLKLIANHGKCIEQSPYIIEYLMNDSQNFQNENIMLMILTASVQLFLIRPAEMQLLLGRILQFASNSNNLLLRKLSTIYNHLLTNININRKMLQITSSENS